MTSLTLKIPCSHCGEEFRSHTEVLDDSHVGINVILILSVLLYCKQYLWAVLVARTRRVTGVHNSTLCNSFRAHVLSAHKNELASSNGAWIFGRWRDHRNPNAANKVQVTVTSKAKVKVKAKAKVKGSPPGVRPTVGKAKAGGGETAIKSAGQAVRRKLINVVAPNTDRLVALFADKGYFGGAAREQVRSML